MKLPRFLEKLTLNSKLAIFAAVLGVIALLIGNPFNNTQAKVNTKELAIEVEETTDHVQVVELADWIIKGKADFKLIDMRNEKDFEEYHIPTAENITITELMDADLGRNEKIVLYSDAGIHSSQAWFLLKAKDYKSVYILFGGLEEWKDKILFPRLSANPTSEETAKFEKMKEISKYFGGTPQTGTENETIQSMPNLPKLSAPSSPGAQPSKKKKREGC